MPREDAESVMRSFTETLNGGDIDGLERYFADTYADRHDNVEAVDDILDAERERYEAFPDKHEAIDVVLDGRGDRQGTHLEVWYSVTGTHEGPFLQLPPTGNAVEFPLLRNVLVKDGHITRYREVYTLGFLLDLGLDWASLTDVIEMDRFMTTPAAAGSARAD